MSTGWLQIVVAVVSAVYSYNQQRKMKKKMAKAKDERAGFDITHYSEPRSLPICYGRNAVHPTVTNIKLKSTMNVPASDNTSPVTWTAGKMNLSITNNKNANGQKIKKNRNEFLFYSGPICQGGIHSVNHVMVDDTEYNSEKFVTDNRGGLRIHTYTDGLAVANNSIGYQNGLHGSDARFTDAAFVDAVFFLNRDDPQFSGIPDIKAFVFGMKEFLSKDRRWLRAPCYRGFVTRWILQQHPECQASQKLHALDHPR